MPSASPKLDTFTVDVPVHALPALRAAAREHDTNVNRLVFDLLTVLASDKLVSAILDSDK
jgi:hypothetical protein